MTRRARAVALLGASIASAGLAASLVNGYASDVRSQIGSPVPVVVTNENVSRGRRITAANVAALLAIRRIPSRFAPPAALRSPLEAVGLRAAVDLEPGGYVERSDLSAPGLAAARRATSPDMRIVEVQVAGAAALGGAPRPGTRVDVLVTSDSAGGGGRTYLALQRIELVGLRSVADAAAGEGPPADGLAIVRVSLRQAVLLTAASNFAREVRLVPRPARDERLLDPTSVGAGELRP